MKHIKYIIFGSTLIFFIASCKKFVEIDPPRTDLIKTTVFTNDATANGAMMDIYFGLKSSGFANGGNGSITFWGTFSSDEQINLWPPYQPFNDNELTPDNSENLSLWSEMYKTIYKANAIIEGLSQSQGVTAILKTQLEGEAKFIRAFCHFYLFNLFGDVPVITTTDYQTNAQLPRSPKAQVYQQIIADLKDAQTLLPANYTFANNERVRVNKFAATAMLARAYLYLEDWATAEIEATTVISNTTLYSLKSNLTQVFLINSSESILQWWSEFRPNERSAFRSAGVPNYGSLRPAFANSFEPGDLRKSTWVNLNPSGYWNSRKYNTANDLPPLEYSTVLRLAEQFLIRAEARAKQNKLVGANSAESDINIIRTRAMLLPTTATTQAQLLLAIEEERNHELFCEWGHRWLDLKRTNRANAILAPLKGSTWQATDVLYPIPQYQILNSTLVQNPGY
jgi:starch-binding outer membrane protein, SusD/RagB family